MTKDKDRSSLCISAGAAAKIMIEAGWTKEQFLEMMSASWEVMKNESNT